MNNFLRKTNIPWIPYINEDWEISKVKDLFYISKSKANQTNPTILSLARSGVKVRDISNNEGQLAADYSNYNPILPGDLLLNPMDLYSGANCNVSEIEGVISPAYSNLRKKTAEVNPKFYDYFFKSQYWLMAMFAHGKGVSFDNRWTLNNDTLLNYEVPLPSKVEQDAIVIKINSKLKVIDELMDITNKRIDKLNKFKTSIISEVVSLGLHNEALKHTKINYKSNLPVSWDVMKMEQICNFITDFVASGSFASLAENVEYLSSPDYAMMIRTADVSGKANTSGNVYVNKHAYNFLSNSNLFGGEIMLPNIGASVGDVYIIPKLYEKMTLGPNSIIFKTKYNDRFFYYYFLSKQGRENLINLNESTAQPKFNKTKLRQLLVPVPSKAEQDEIVNYLDKNVEIVDSLLKLQDEKIKKLENLKKSLIYKLTIGG